MHTIKINGFDPEAKWGLCFADGVYQELVKAPRKKTSPLEMDWRDEDGVESDRSYNKYESRLLTLPAFVSAADEGQMLLRFNAFVREVLLTSEDVLLDTVFLNRRYRLRYLEMTNVEWSEEVVLFNIVMSDDFPTDNTPAL